jgi:hypothetical protein
MATKNKGPKIDNGTAPATDMDGQLRAAMQGLRPVEKSTPVSVPAKPARSKKAKSKKVDKDVKPEVLENEAPTEMFSMKGQLTLKEQLFVELYLTGDLTLDKAMESAGYIGYHPNSLYRLGRKIVQKYESLVGDHRKIMRAMGYGETKVLNLLIDSAINAKSEMVRLNARTFLAKCLGMQQDVIDVVSGISIVFNAAQPGAQPEPGPGGGRPANQVEPKPLPRAITITR